MSSPQTALIHRNRLANLKNQYQGPYRRVLCVCSAGMLRSPTAAWILSNEPFNFNTREAGTEDYAVIRVDHGLIYWADDIVVMDEHQEFIINHKIQELENWWGRPMRIRVHVLNIPDNYDYKNPKLVESLTERLTKIFID